MYFNEECLTSQELVNKTNIKLPLFNRRQVKENTKKNPKWIHFGPGNIFRAFIANLQQSLLDRGEDDCGIIAVAPNNSEIIDKIYRPHDNLSLLVTMNADGSNEKKIIASITESLTCDMQNKVDWERIESICIAGSLQIMSFTITEKGYKLKKDNGEYLESVKQDLQMGPSQVKSFMGKITSLLYKRYLNGAKPVSLVSMDNCSHNGIVLHDAILDIAKIWIDRNLVKREFQQYLEKNITYPCTMIDKITPYPSEKIQEELKQDGFNDMDFVVSSRGSKYAPFVNAEKTEYLVVEDSFINGRPALEKTGVIFTDRATVDKVEKMKVCTCLNPLHTALAIFGCLLGYTSISSEMNSPLLRKLVEKIGYDEGMKVVIDPGVILPKEFIEKCINERFPNSAIPDTPQRIACDTSQKVAIRFGETIKAYMKSNTLKSEDLVYIPLTIAAWCRYLLGIDDKGNEFSISPDPLLEVLQSKLGNINLGDKINVHNILEDILSDSKIFGVNLYDAGIGEKIDYQPNRKKPPVWVKRIFEKNGIDLYNSKREEIIQKYLIREKKKDLSTWNIENGDLQTLCYVSNCGLSFDNHEFSMIMRKIFSYLLSIISNVEDYDEFIDVYAVDEVITFISNGLCDKDSSAIVDMLFDLPDFGQMSYELYEEIAAHLLAVYFDAYKNIEIRRKCEVTLLAIEDKISHICELEVRNNLCKMMFLTLGKIHMHDWNELHTEYSYKDKMFLNEIWSKYGWLHFKNLLYVINQMHITELLPEVILPLNESLRKCGENYADCKEMIKANAVIINKIITKAFLDFNDDIKCDHELVKAFEEVLETLVGFGMEEAAVILDEFRVH